MEAQGSREGLIAARIAEAIAKGMLEPGKTAEFVTTIAGTDYCLDIRYEEDWSEPYVLVTDEMGRHEYGSDLLGYSHFKIDYAGSFTSEGDYLSDKDLNVGYITNKVMEKVNEKA